MPAAHDQIWTFPEVSQNGRSGREPPFAHGTLPGGKRPISDVEVRAFTFRKQPFRSPTLESFGPRPEIERMQPGRLYCPAVQSQIHQSKRSKPRCLSRKADLAIYEIINLV